MTQDAVSQDQALARLFAVIADEARLNPAFGKRLVEATSMTVIYEGAEALDGLDPVAMVARRSETQFRAIWGKASIAALSKALVNSGLASKPEVKTGKGGKSKDQLLTMLWERARDRAAETGRI